MVKKTERTNGPGGPRSAGGRQFEVFVRESEADALRHVGTVAAPTPDAAHEEASKLFAWYARDVWVCPASETHRYSAESLGAEAEKTDDESHRTSADEPRVYEETEGTPTVACSGVPARSASTDLPDDDSADSAATDPNDALRGDVPEDC